MRNNPQKHLDELRKQAWRKTIILLFIVATPLYIAYRCDVQDHERYEKEFHEEDIVDKSTFSKYVTIRAEEYCKRMNEIRQINNSDKSLRETEILMNEVSYFKNSTIRDIGMNKDFADNIVNDIQRVFEEKLRQCGYFDDDYSSNNTDSNSNFQNEQNNSGNYDYESSVNEKSINESNVNESNVNEGTANKYNSSNQVNYSSEYESAASFPGGQQALVNYLANNINYPEVAIENGIQGRVIVRFSIDANGEIENAVVDRGLNNCEECNIEALRVVNKMPKWIPAKKDGIAIKSWLSIPINYKSN